MGNNIWRSGYTMCPPSKARIILYVIQLLSYSFLPFNLLMLCHFLVLMRYNAGKHNEYYKAQDEDVASLFQALRRNKSITYLRVNTGEYG